MADYLGDYAIGDSVFCDFNTRDYTSHAPATLSGTPSCVIYNAASFTPITLGIFLSVNINGVVGLNHVDVVATAANGYTPGNTYYFVLAAGTVGGVSMVGEIVGSFSIAARYNIRNFPGGSRALMIDANGVANANVTAMATDVFTAAAVKADAVFEIQNGLASAMAVDILQTTVNGIQSDTDNIQTRIPAALIGGRMDSNVGAMAPNTLNASALATDAVNEIQAGLATAADIATADDAVLARLGVPINGSVTADIALVKADTEAIRAKTILIPDDPAHSADVASIKADTVAIVGKTNNLPPDPAARSDLVAAFTMLDSSISEVPTNAELTAALEDLPTNGELALALDVLPTAAEITDAVWEEALADHQIAGSMGEAQSDAGAGGTPPTPEEISDVLLGRNLAGGSDGGRTVRDALRSLRNKTRIVDNVLDVFKEDDSTIAWQAVTTTAPGDPLTSIDPA